MRIDLFGITTGLCMNNSMFAKHVFLCFFNYCAILITMNDLPYE